MNERKLEKGFTMVELIAVLLLIGVLAAYAVPKLYGTSEAAYKKAAEQAAADGISLVKRAYAGAILLSKDGTASADDTMTQLKNDLSTDLISTTTGEGEEKVTTNKLDMGEDFYITFEVAGNNIKILGTYKNGPDDSEITMDADNALVFECDE